MLYSLLNYLQYFIDIPQYFLLSEMISMISTYICSDLNLASKRL